jgi:hypothetical protein
MKHILYKITRSDGQQYIGTTIDYRLKNRMSQHKLSDRFKDYDFEYEILLESDDRLVIQMTEENAINEYDTFNNGLNSTKGGKGYGHNSSLFTTFGYKFDDQSRQKMSLAAKERAKREGFEVRSNRTKKFYSDNPEVREKMSKNRRGKKGPFKLNDDDIKLLKEQYSTFNHPDIGKKAKNGRTLTKQRLFANFIAQFFNVTSCAVYVYVKDL